MNMQTLFIRPVKVPVFGFLGLCGMAAAVTVAEGMGFVDVAATKRIIGLIIGLMALVIGNFLPKTRPLKVLGGNPAKAIATERSIGWTLALAGIADVVLFAFAPLNQARPLSSIVGIGTILVIAASCILLARRTPVSGQPITEEVVRSEHDASTGKLMAYLLFSFFWIFSTACVVFLFDHQPWVNNLTTWMMMGFGFLYAAMNAVLNYKTCTR